MVFVYSRTQIVSLDDLCGLAASLTTIGVKKLGQTVIPSEVRLRAKSRDLIHANGAVYLTLEEVMCASTSKCCATPSVLKGRLDKISLDSGSLRSA
jgi:hypothetical protein